MQQLPKRTAVTNSAPKEQYTVVVYIQYNQDSIRKIQVQNDYIQEDSTSTKGQNINSVTTRNFNVIDAFLQKSIGAETLVLLYGCFVDVWALEIELKMSNDNNATLFDWDFLLRM